MRLYMFKLQLVSVTQKKSGHQGCDYKGGLLYHENFMLR